MGERRAGVGDGTRVVRGTRAWQPRKHARCKAGVAVEENRGRREERKQRGYVFRLIPY
jgi:hypothetical protein